MITLLIADDEDEIRLALRDIVPWEENNISVVGLAKTGLEARDLTAALQPEVALVDVRMPGLQGIKLIRELRRVCPGLVIIVLSGFDNSELIEDMISAGANAYLVKPTDPVEILATVIRLANSRYQP